jgi:sugar phosphate permease
VKKKWLVLLLLWLTFMVSYLDRVNVSTAGPLMMKELHMDAGSFGVILSAFTFGYGLMQIPGGMLADRFGSKATMMFGLIWWSIFTALSGVCCIGWYVNRCTSIIWGRGSFRNWFTIEITW